MRAFATPQKSTCLTDVWKTISGNLYRRAPIIDDYEYISFNKKLSNSAEEAVRNRLLEGETWDKKIEAVGSCHFSPGIQFQADLNRGMQPRFDLVDEFFRDTAEPVKGLISEINTEVLNTNPNLRNRKLSVSIRTERWRPFFGNEDGAPSGGRVHFHPRAGTKDAIYNHSGDSTLIAIPKNGVELPEGKSNFPLKDFDLKKTPNDHILIIGHALHTYPDLHRLPLSERPKRLVIILSYEP